jgi:hypothetical protein
VVWWVDDGLRLSEFVGFGGRARLGWEEVEKKENNRRRQPMPMVVE